MTSKCIKVLALSAFLCASAQAATVTFAPLTSFGQGPAGDGTTYQEAGMTFTSSVVNPEGLYHWGTSQSFNADPNGATLFQNYPGESLIVTQTGGGAFTLTSLDLADAYNTGAATAVFFSWTDGGGNHSTTLTLDTNVGLQTFVLGLAGVTQFSIRQDDPYFQVDNIVINGVVPEPQTYALMAIGLLAVGALARRKGARSHG